MNNNTQHTWTIEPKILSNQIKKNLGVDILYAYLIAIAEFMPRIVRMVCWRQLKFDGEQMFQFHFDFAGLIPKILIYNRKHLNFYANKFWVRATNWSSSEKICSV